MRITDRHGGVSTGPYGSRNLGGLCGDEPDAVAANRARTAAEFGLERVVFMRQVHSADVRYVSAPFGDDPPPLDGICTDVPGLGLAALCADCAPVLLAEPRAGLVGAAHSGRVGTVSGVVTALVEEMAKRGAVPARMTALIGPMACGTCYEVPAELREEVAVDLPEAWSITSGDTPALDLRAAITSQLGRAGVGEIIHDTRCTIETADLFSHRREGTTGRFAGYVWLEP
ncbi:peptidoglycan editing factor PgeF [Streptosporangium sp. NBC_01755]|uniref:peptidoglycan editing factor PgeF n=1 Tax=unclassified Streptosporangium TaxID=2632669 RepID=UPI002DDC0ED8|nr:MULTISPECIES: peptidoglycan editing factor PgeF [unclassified Streptosporangium]WSA29561.1 peptidoglycan editing factor PgeF [Streptosporangium sp. NBC_01810]WSD04010.1 peptidoglycan editing factor PgeF [Streptosporangium sp. NBC_01755]